MSEYHNVLILGKSMRLLLRALLIEIQANKEWVIAQKSGGKAVKRRKLLELSQGPFFK
ncbi:hypothetical protein V12G01_07023 [Vibrio alginolyticus 12G01]|nr:hypothetical protein V12G01_07023 [Vibrio alginolyticus 12G01]